MAIKNSVSNYLWSKAFVDSINILDCRLSSVFIDTLNTELK